MMDNVSAMTVITLSGLSGLEKYRIPLFIATFLCYCLIWVANVTIIVTIIMEKNLHEPMYIFLCNLCINGLFGTTGFFPKFLIDLLSSTHVISYAGCLLQGYVLHVYIGADLSILLLMAFDRYVAICRPLVYHSVMTRQTISILIFFAWFIPLQLISLGSLTVTGVKICSTHINKIYCVPYLVNRLACTPFLAAVVVPAFNYTFYFCHFGVIFWSYIHIINTCIKSKENQVKFMKTCLPHIICLLTFVVCILFDLLYIRSGSKLVSKSVENFMAVEYLVVPPICNPLVYGLNLTKIRNHLLKTFRLKL
ncbi:olfactory receptor 151-like [Periophthalmus magnuspinnatus]|uniref:olfactory receptor 151-like n=1 Tax=Periophthalmus magnuspinnatus TaxID=409849 RepID=UPI00145BBE46|nr:olfactory receptor 151-like [Periophthalmus magnuspinnatus]